VNDPHFGFVAAAYCLGFLIIAGMILSILIDYRSLKRALEKFSARQDQENS
jgi:heme exporter protein CcmD